MTTPSGEFFLPDAVFHQVGSMLCSNDIHNKQCMLYVHVPVGRPTEVVTTPIPSDRRRRSYASTLCFVGGILDNCD